MQPKNRFRVFVHNPGDTQGWSNFEQVWCQALVQAAIPLSLNGLLRHVPYAGVCGWMHHGALRLQARPHHIERVHDRRTDCTRGRTDHTGGHVAGRNVILVTSGASRVIALIRLLEQFEHAHVDGAVGEHAHQTHRHTAVTCLDATISEHLDRRLANKRSALQSALDTLAL